MKISHREKIFMITSVIIVLLTLYYSLFYKNIRHEINGIKDDITRNKNDLAALARSESQIKELKKDIAKLLTETEEIPFNSDRSQVESKMIVFLEDSIKNLGMGTRVKFENVEEQDEYYMVPVILNLETSYDNLEKILLNVEKAPWPHMIDEIKATKHQSESINSSYNWEVEAIIRFLVFP